jgi:hypothetical protein
MKALAKLLLISTVVFLVSRPLAAENTTNTLSLKMFVVYANNENQKVDPALNFVKEELESLFHYTSYQLMDTPTENFKLNESKEIQLASGHTAFIRYLGVHGHRIHLRVQIKNKKETVVNTDFEIMNSGNVIVGGPSFKKGALILVLHGVY